MLLALDRAAGGRSEFLKTEFRRCEMCGRPLISHEAAKRRALVATSPTARALPCGPGCERDRTSEFWKKMAPNYRTRRDEAA
jgi:hypothetical protein